MMTNSKVKEPTPRVQDKIRPDGEYRVAIYARSASETTSYPTSHVSTQIAELEGLCEQRRWRVSDCYVDRGTSGMSTVRKGLHDLFRDAEARPRLFDAVLVRDLSRLSRSIKVAVALVEHLQAFGLEVRTPNQCWMADISSAR